MAVAANQVSSYTLRSHPTPDRRHHHHIMLPGL